MTVKGAIKAGGFQGWIGVVDFMELITATL